MSPENDEEVTPGASSPRRPPPEPPMLPPGARTIINELPWLVPVLLSILGLTVLLSLTGPWGADAAALLGIPLNILGLVVPILAARGSWRFPPGLLRPGARLKIGVGIAVLALLGSVLVYYNGREPSPTEAMSGKIRIGYVGGYRGWHIDSSTRSGFEVSMVQSLEDAFPNMQVEWVELDTLEERIDALRGTWGGGEKPVDLVIANFSMTMKRQEQIDFAGPYFIDKPGFVSRDSTTTEIEQITPGKLCVLKGTTMAERLAKLGWVSHPEASLSACFNKYLHNEYDAVSTDATILRSFLVNSKYKDIRKNLRTLPYGIEKYGIGIPNNRPKLCAALNRALSDFVVADWDTAFTQNLVPIGEKVAYHKPPRTDPCEPAGGWDRWF